MNEEKKLQKKSVPFLEILRQSARIVWENRFLLWFGLLMALGSPGSFNINTDKNKLGPQGDAIRSFFETHWQVVVFLALLFLVIGIVLFLISLVAKAGLVKSVNLLSQNRTTNFKEGWQAGKKYLGKLFWISVLFFLVTLALLIVLTIPVIYLVATKSWISAVLVGLLAIAIFIPLIFIFFLTKIFAEFYVILSGLGIRNALETGYDLLLKNVGNSIIFSLLLLAVITVAGIAMVATGGIALLILVPTGALFYYLSKIVFGFFLVTAILLFVALILFVSSIFQAYKMTAWTLFFREIAKAEKPEPEKVTEEEFEENIAATPASSELHHSESLERK